MSEVAGGYKGGRGIWFCGEENHDCFPAIFSFLCVLVTYSYIMPRATSMENRERDASQIKTVFNRCLTVFKFARFFNVLTQIVIEAHCCSNRKVNS